MLFRYQGRVMPIKKIKGRNLNHLSPPSLLAFKCFSPPPGSPWSWGPKCLQPPLPTPAPLLEAPGPWSWSRGWLNPEFLTSVEHIFKSTVQTLVFFSKVKKKYVRGDPLETFLKIQTFFP